MLATLPPVLGSTPLPGQHRVPPPISRPGSKPPSPKPKSNQESRPSFPPSPRPMSTPTFVPPRTYCDGRPSNVPCTLRDENTVPGGGE